MQHLSFLDRAGVPAFQTDTEAAGISGAFRPLLPWELGGGAGQGVLCEWAGDTLQRGGPARIRWSSLLTCWTSMEGVCREAINSQRGDNPSDLRGSGSAQKS